MDRTPVLIDTSAIQAAPFRYTEPSERCRAALRLSVERHGILQPLHVRRIEDPAYNYQIIDGHCRWAAAADLKVQVPCYIHESLTLDEARVLAQELNLTRGELNHTLIAKLFSANAKFIGYSLTVALTSWPPTTVESYVAMADFDWESYRREAQGVPGLFGPEPGSDDDTGEW